ncbi:MAG: response regulator, partial [Chloroflexota bacterium]|nr:response regulator [Chloroflexota bacterium]
DHIRNVVTRTLQIEGYDVQNAANGTDALEKFTQDDYHLVIIDVKMPGISGLDVLRQIKTDRPTTTAIMLTGVSDNEATREIAITNGAFDVLTKPCSLDILLETIKKVV